MLEPQTPLIDGWPLEATCQHLEAITDGEIVRFLENVPPGFMKSLLVNVFWPAWEWGPMNLPHKRYVSFSYSSSLTERDNSRFLALLESREYQELYGDRFTLREAGKVKVSNDKTGWKLASSVGGVGTGERGDRVLLDDPHNVKEAESETVRSETVRWFRESMSNRLNDMQQSAIVVIMQRVHEADVSGTILSEGMNYCHLMIPMEYDWHRHCVTEIGWEDPRGLDEDGDPLIEITSAGPAPLDGEAERILDDRFGAMAWPARFPAGVLAEMRATLGPYAYAGQYQQAPAPRGGGIIKRDWWQLWEPPDGKWPSFDYLIASLDGAFTEKEENDPSAMTVWGVFKGPGDLPCAMLVKAWRKWLRLHGNLVERERSERYGTWRRRAEPEWGLVEWVAETCRFRNSDGVVIGTVDKLLIESKASGISAAQEIQRLYGTEGWITELADPKGDKVARAHAVVPIFANAQVYAPDRDWAEMVIDEMEAFPKARHDDLTDSATQALKHLRTAGLLQYREEIRYDEERRSMHRKKAEPLYPV